MARTRVDQLAELSMVPPLAQKMVEFFGNADQAAIAAIAPLADPETATAPQIAAKVNEIIAALQG